MPAQSFVVKEFIALELNLFDLDLFIFVDNKIKNHVVGHIRVILLNDFHLSVKEAFFNIMVLDGSFGPVEQVSGHL